MAARVNTGGGGGVRFHKPPCIFHETKAFNNQFIISASGEKNSERERNDLDGEGKSFGTEVWRSGWAMRGKPKRLDRKANCLL